jgi:hypothetical protein
MNNFKLEVTFGTSIETAIKEAIASLEDKMPYVDSSCDVVWFVFNGMKVNVRRTDNVDLILQHWEVARWLDEKEIGEYGYQEIPQEKLKMYDDAKEAYEEKIELQRLIDKSREDKLKSEIQLQIEFEELEMNNQEEWEKIVELNSSEPYSLAAITFVDNLGRLLQTKIKLGEQIDKSVCDKYSFIVSDMLGGLSGFQAGTGINHLKRHWKYGYLIE